MSPEQKKRQAERNRKWRAKKKKDAPPEKGKERWILPCGEDCENCPFEECKYTDEKEDALEREEEQEYHRRAARESYYRKKAEMEKDPELAEAYKRRKKEDMQRFLERKDEKMKSDPEFREQEKEKARVKARKYYHETYKEKMRSDPEFREKERVKQHNRGKKYYESHKEKVLARQKANYEKCKEKRRQQAQPEDNIKNKEENDHGQ